MLAAIIILTLLPMLVTCVGDGNIHLLEDEIEEALRSCSNPINDSKENNQRSRRSDEYDEQYSERTPRIDNAKQDLNLYGHQRRNTTDMKDQMHVLNASDFDYGYGSGNGGEKLVKAVPRPANGGDYGNMTGSENVNRTRRNEPLFNTPDSDQVDSRGIPREKELWTRIQSSLKSQQSRVALHDQTRACFQELQSEAEDNGCLYSNKLENCLMLRLSDRNAGDAKRNSEQN